MDGGKQKLWARMDDLASFQVIICRIAEQEFSEYALTFRFARCISGTIGQTFYFFRSILGLLADCLALQRHWSTDLNGYDQSHSFSSALQHDELEGLYVGDGE